MPFEWKGPRSGRIAWPGPRRRRVDRDHDNELDWEEREELELDTHAALAWRMRDRLDPDKRQEVKRLPAAKLPHGTRLYPCQSRSGYLEPDATLIGGSDEHRFAVLLEYDQPTGRTSRSIACAATTGGCSKAGATLISPHTRRLRASSSSRRERPLRCLSETADRTLSAWHCGPDAGPREGVHPAREQMLFTSRERILVEDWTMQRAPSLPPGLREQPEVCAPRELVYDLPWLLSRASAGASAQTKVSRALSLVDQCARH